MSDQEKPSRKRLFCNTCQGDTHHALCGQHQRHYYEDDGHYWEETAYRLWTCAGCDTGTLEIAWTSAAMRGPEEQLYDYTYAPRRTTSALAVRRFRQIPNALKVIYEEVIHAFNAGLPLLSAAGLRAPIEGICADKGLKGQRLAAKIDGLSAHMHVGIVKNLHGFRFMGNDAVHELKAPDLKDLRLAIEVSEDLLNYLYDLDYKSRLLPTRTPRESASTSEPS